VHAAAVCFDLHVPESRSLKAKRAAIRPVVDGLRHRFKVSVAEVDHQDTWQRSTLLAAVCAGGHGRVADHADAVERWLESRLPEGIRVERRIASWADLESIG
jgi:uncharacterized protein YlxP (DUF503 family)